MGGHANRRRVKLARPTRRVLCQEAIRGRVKVPEGPTGRAESSEAVGGPRRGGSPVGVNVRIFVSAQTSHDRLGISSAGFPRVPAPHYHWCPCSRREHIARGAPPPR